MQTASTSKEGPANQVIFLAMGYAYVVMAINAARSVRASGTTAQIKLITNFPISRIKYGGIEPFDDIEVVDTSTQENRWIKTNIAHRASGLRNVLLDCDVEVLAPLDPIFDLLGNFDVAARNLPFETRVQFPLSNGKPMNKYSLGEINTGVIFFSKSDGALELLNGWHDEFLAMDQWRDQPAFLRALLESKKVRFFPLPPMWNATPFPSVDRAEMKRKPRSIRILHYRDPTFWPAVGRRLADVHEHAEIVLSDSSAAFKEEYDDYSRLARQYLNPLFQIAAGRLLLNILMKLSPGKRKRLRVVGERKVPRPSTQKTGNKAL